jgi:hypothetical protein
VASAALALLRCRDRIGPLLQAISASRRLELARAVSELEGFDDAHLKRVLDEIVRGEAIALRDGVTLFLGAASEQAPRAIQKWAARAIGR